MKSEHHRKITDESGIMAKISKANVNNENNERKWNGENNQSTVIEENGDNEGESEGIIGMKKKKWKSMKKAAAAAAKIIVWRK